jgi:hypothetical protein
MIHEDTEVIFPPRVIPVLKNLRSPTWRNLVSKVEACQAEEPNRLAFVLLMARLCGCATCHADSYRAMRGCTLCSVQTIRRYRESDEDLLEEYSAALKDVFHYLQDKGTTP